MRKVLLTRRWIGLTALAVVLILAFLALGWWQLQRGEQGNARSWGYTFQWPAFAIFVGYMWVRMLRDDLRPAEDAPAPAPAADLDPLPAGRTDGGAGTGRVAAASDVREDEDDDEPGTAAELAAYNRYLAALNAPSPRPGPRPGVRR